MKSFTSPCLTLVDSFIREKTLDGWRHTFPQRHCSINEAAMLCFVINSASDVTYLNFERGDGLFSHAMVKEGKWVWIVVLTQSSLVEREAQFELWTSSLFDNGMLEVDCVETGLLVMGEENRVVCAFYELLQHLGKVDDIMNNKFD